MNAEHLPLADDSFAQKVLLIRFDHRTGARGTFTLTINNSVRQKTGSILQLRKQGALELSLHAERPPINIKSTI
jgi:hypothetical protein